MENYTIKPILFEFKLLVKVFCQNSIPLYKVDKQKPMSDLQSNKGSFSKFLLAKVS